MRRSIMGTVFFLLFGGILCGCTAAPRFVSRRPVKGHTGEFVFAAQTGIASYYGIEFHGLITSSGEIYDREAMTAAHRTLPLGTVVEVENLETGERVEVEINDRGPFIDGRIIDLSEGAARKIGIIEKGTAIVRVEMVR